MKSRTLHLLLAVILTRADTDAQDANDRAYIAPTFPDPAVPMIQLPTDFKAQRVNTEVYLQVQRAGVKPGRGLRGERGSSFEILKYSDSGIRYVAWPFLSERFLISLLPGAVYAKAYPTPLVVLVTVYQA